MFKEGWGVGLRGAYRPPQPGLPRTETDGWEDIDDPACIHGHAVFERFSWVTAVPDARFVTFLREPLTSAVSFWRYERRAHTPWDPRAEMRPCSADVEEYLLEQYNHNRYSQWIARAERRLEEFFFVGLVERFDESMATLFRLCGWPSIDYGHENRSEGSVPGVRPATAQLFRERNADDYDLWRRADALLEQHLRAGGVPGPE